MQHKHKSKEKMQRFFVFFCIFCILCFHLLSSRLLLIGENKFAIQIHDKLAIKETFRLKKKYIKTQNRFGQKQIREEFLVNGKIAFVFPGCLAQLDNVVQARFFARGRASFATFSSVVAVACILFTSIVIVACLVRAF